MMNSKYEEFFKTIYAYYKTNKRGSSLARAYREVVKTGDPELNYQVALLDPRHAKPFLKVVLEKGSAEQIVSIARSIKSANIKDCQQAVIKRGEPMWIYRFANDIKSGNIAELQKAIIQLKATRYAYLFARNIKGADIQTLQNFVLESGDAEYIYLFAVEVKGADKALCYTKLYKMGATRYISLFNKYANAEEMFEYQSLLDQAKKPTNKRVKKDLKRYLDELEQQ